MIEMTLEDIGKIMNWSIKKVWATAIWKNNMFNVSFITPFTKLNSRKTKVLNFYLFFIGI